MHLTGAEHVIEFGTFTGYSAIAMKEALPEDGSVWTLESNPAHAEVAKRYIDKANEGGGAQIVLRVEDGHKFPLPGEVYAAPVEFPVFDTAFIDAEKEGYIEYRKLAKAHVGEFGLIIADNTLSNIRKDVGDPSGRAIKAFNDMVRNDRDVHAVILPVRDGMTVAYVK